MENASKALLIAGGILISMLVISIGVYLFASYRGLATSHEQTMQADEIREFNVKFEKFEGREDITIQEIVTLVNFCKQYEEQTEIHNKVILSGQGDLTTKKDNIISLIQENSIENETNKNKYFKFVKVDYDNDGKINSISFTSN